MALFGKFKDLVGLEEYDEYDEITEEEIAETIESLDKPATEKPSGFLERMQKNDRNAARASLDRKSVV